MDRETKGLSPLFCWLAGIVVAMEAVALVQSAINLASPTMLTELFQQQLVLGIGLGCIGMAGWAVPVISAILLATAKKRGYHRWIKTLAIVFLAAFVLKMALGIGWGILVAVAMVKSGAAANPKTMAAQVITDNMPFFYVLQTGMILIGLAQLAMLGIGWKAMGGTHFVPLPPEENDDDDSDEEGGAWAKEE